MARGRPGPAPQTAKREQFARLIARGTSNAEACRIVGVNARTGKRWRHGRTIISSSGARLHYPPVTSARKQLISERYLSEDGRVRIADLRRSGLGVRAIARRLDRSASTVSRELGRNQDPDSGQYRPFTAQQAGQAFGTGPPPISASVTELPTGAGDGTGEHLPTGAFHFAADLPNDARLARFIGGAPPPGDGRHRYFIVVQAIGIEKVG
jgi:transposase-like protein